MKLKSVFNGTIVEACTPQVSTPKSIIIPDVESFGVGVYIFGIDESLAVVCDE
ncbi:MAG: hypothetical protein ACKESB_03875 [Candidatus Hodgkinia cicadicola]